MLQGHRVLFFVLIEATLAGAFSSSFLRGLSEPENQNEDMAHQTDPVVFWGVNAFILTLLISVCSWLWCCGGYKGLTQVQQSDLQYAQRVQQRNAEREARRQMSPQERQAAIIQSLRRNQVRMIVKQDDLVAEADHQHHRDNETTENPDTIIEGNENSEDEHVVFAIPDDMMFGSAPAQDHDKVNAAWDMTTASNLFGTLILRQLDNLEAGRVPNQCAICLGNYCVDDPVVWSSNPDCSHAFHENCLVDWLVHSKQDGTPCPCCRQSFTDLVSFRKERKIRWSPDRAFDPSALRLR